ncbi:sugar phosphate isomerase/epimerase family protein [Maribacter cobaltidurans]|uniref:Endonuclease n=1 Tax=Maribacter cobaltidurans TaxID=1178778 RepID=A0A223V8G2_9FLAO|nr:sugar phosphate isomerase/epimerase family protein [Maribacter cobaltidurans]ASV31695.1 endonuclease [Maribacter cobaltidurans]GGD93719.1 xylose isomerase [Maribacter cobaltidurans]
MNQSKISRRQAIKSGSLLALSVSTASAFAKNIYSKSPLDHSLPFRVSLNTSTLMAYKLPVDVQIEKVAAAGFDGIELWMRDIMTYLDQGGSTESLKRKLEEGNLKLENIIGFSEWCSDESEKREKAINQLREEMNIIKELGGSYIAAPIMGLSKLEPSKMQEYADRYKAILDLEEETGVIPVLELWGMGALHKISDCAQIVIATGHPKASILLDFYHVHRGGNSWDTVDVINGAKLPVMHMNDYPAEPTYDKLTDADRVLPGEGVCPFDYVVPKLYEAGFRGAFSVELFNKGYWESMDADTLLKKSFESSVLVLSSALQKAGLY